MFILGHTGITLAAAVLINAASTKSRSSATRVKKLREQRTLGTAPLQNFSPAGIMSWITSLADHIDIRLLIIGSLLPDIIDKPIGMYFFQDTFSSGRIFCHTLLFLIFITLGGLFLYWSYKRTWLIVLSFGTFTHLILDLMWRTPRTLLWPLYGSSFERSDLSHLWQDVLYGVLTNPTICISELVGLVLIVWFISLLVRRRSLYTFIRTSFIK